ncbi:MAG: hypothetical protein AB8G99_24200 [Planctomycetaceae bacterium]
MSGFWAGGARDYKRALNREYDAASRCLRSLVSNEADAGKRKELEKELVELEDRFRSRLNAIDRSVF